MVTDGQSLHARQLSHLRRICFEKRRGAGHSKHPPHGAGTHVPTSSLTSLFQGLLICPSLPSTSLYPICPMISSAVARQRLTEGDFLDSVRPLLQLNTANHKWYRSLTGQSTEGKEAFSHMKRLLKDEDLIAMLLHEFWIACLPSADGMTDRLIFDLDAASDGDEGKLKDRYEALRAALGWHRVPLVYRTPHGGLHVVYRITRVSIKPLITGRESGVVADALRDAGLRIADGSLELYPQGTRAIRVPLGQGMALLDPANLRPIPDAAIGDVFDVDMLMGAVRHMVEWYAIELDDLITHLGHMASHYRRHHSAGATRDQARQTPSRGPRSRVSRAARDLVDHGLRAPGTRHHVEFQVGAVIWAEPSWFGLPANPSSEQVAYALAEWLLTHHNGFSTEWAKHRRRCRSDDEALRTWARDRYLSRDGHGRTAVDRMRNVGQIQGPARIPSFEEREEVLRIVDAAGWPRGPSLYRAEVWCMAALRAVREILWWRGVAPRPGETTVIPIAAEWMENWPFGAGRVGGETTAYVAYRELLERAELMVPEAYHSHHPGNPFPGVATRYRVRVPVACDALDLGMSIADIRHRIRRETAYGRPLSLDEAIHALHVSQSIRNLDQRYGATVANHIRRIAALVLPQRRFA